MEESKRIDRNKLINRKYNENKECIGFEYELEIEDVKGRTTFLPFYFKRLSEKYWEVNLITKNKIFGELRAYSTEYEMPLRNMNLEIITAYGLRYIQSVLQAEVQYKSMIDFCIGDVIASTLK